MQISHILTPIHVHTFTQLTGSNTKHVSRSKAWPVVDWKVHEIVIVNMFLIAWVANKRQSICNTVNKVHFNGNLFARYYPTAISWIDKRRHRHLTVMNQQRQKVVGRLYPESVRLHHSRSTWLRTNQHNPLSILSQSLLAFQRVCRLLGGHHCQWPCRPGKTQPEGNSDRRASTVSWMFTRTTLDQ